MSISPIDVGGGVAARAPTPPPTAAPTAAGTKFVRRASTGFGVRLAAVEAGRDDGDAHLVAEGVVDDGTEDDVGLGVHGLLHESCGVVDLEDAEVRPALDREQHAVRAVDRRLEQRARDRELGGLDRAVGAPRRADAHERGAGALHDRLDVGEVEVDEAGRRDEVGDALHTGEEHLVGGGERLEHR